MNHWASKIQDRWLGLGLSAFTLLAIPVIARALREILRLTAVTQDGEPPLSVVDISVTQNKEDAISLDTLKVLTRCPNHEIRTSAMKMLLVRASKDTKTLISLHKDLSSPETELRTKAQLSHDLLKEFLTACPFAGLQVWRMRDDNRGSAVATADSVETADSSNTDRTGGEAQRPADKIEDTCPICLRRLSGSSGSSGGSTEMAPYDSHGNVIMSMPLSASPLSERRVRARAESPEEVALRRRRREAIVLNDGDRPVAQEDIIQRRASDMERLSNRQRND